MRGKSIIGKEDVERGKPHADTFAVAAAKLGARPEDCVVFEDAVLGEQAAYKAGMHVVAVASSLKAKDFQNPLAVIKDFTGFTPERLLELLEQQPDAPKSDKQRAQRQYMHLD
jgi:beta-phosphoglucomutase-like phosphatase (HAD superfamily)